jgi:BCD family chlorophyll transporter-like MFS transporter
MTAPLGWFGIFRLALVQAALGAIVVLTTATMNRVMVVELKFPAWVPGGLVALHYAIQVLRPSLGYGSDRGRQRTPWIMGGMAVLAAGAIAAAAAIIWMDSNATAGICLAILAFGLVGLGVGACGTSLLVLLGQRVAPARRPAAASFVWMMMIAGIALTAGSASRLLDPFSPVRLLGVTAAFAVGALLLTLLAVRGIEDDPGEAGPIEAELADRLLGFRQALAEVWAEPVARRFTLFVFVSMFAYSAQELILEPFGGLVLGLSPGQSAGLTGLLHGGVLGGMLLVAIAGSFWQGSAGLIRLSTVGGCAGSAAAVLAVAAAAFAGPAWPLRPALIVLGAANGVFSVSAIGAMMGLAHTGRSGCGGLRMGLWGRAGDRVRARRPRRQRCERSVPGHF